MSRDPANTGDEERTTREDRDPLLGKLLGGRYRVDYELAAGGFGAIYRGEDVRKGREVALKVLHRGLAADPKLVKRFRREGKALETLRNPHTLRAYELGETRDGTLYIAVELLHGETLHDRLARGGPFSQERAIAIARAICKSLGEAHARGIVHRDLKPSNIHLEQRGDNPDFVKVLDFGIAKILRGSDLGHHTELTDTGRTVGTPEYMTPEQITGDTVTNRTDIYAVGVLLYEMLVGERPYRDANNVTSMLASILNGPAPRLSARLPDLSPELDRIVARCLEREPSARFASVGDLDVALALVGAHRELRPPAAQVTSDGEDRTTHWPRPYRPSAPPQAPMFVANMQPPPPQAPRFDLGHAVHRDAWARRVTWGVIVGVLVIIAIIVIVKL
jgi:serine/threonine-protein kinase